jgi:radical SAM superfamily enzyme YgiQ (UPF0313 family)
MSQSGSNHHHETGAGGGAGALRKRLLLISPVASGSLMGGDFFFRMPGLGLLRVAALTPPSWEVQFIDEKVEPLDLTRGADLVGITSMTSTVTRGYEIADAFRRRGIKVAMGGMHVSQMPEEALQHCDSVVVGEAEGLWSAVIRDFEAGQLRRRYDHGEELPSLGGLPQADWSLYDDKRYLPVHFVETTRGCPLDCEFCSVTKAFGGRYRSRPVEEVIAELRGLRPFGGWLTLRNSILFVDDNIVSNRAYAKEFFTRLKGMGFRWFGQASVNIARDPELLKLCQESGCTGLFIGLETLSPQAIAGIGKKVNRPNEYLEVIQRLHDHGIGVDTSFVLGLDEDDSGVFDRTLEFVLKAKVEIAYFSILTPYPGTRLHHRLREEGRLLTEDWSLYDGARVVYRPRQLTPDQLLEGHFRMLREFYSASSIVGRLWGASSYKNFFYPMNFGFKYSAGKLYRAYRRDASRFTPVAAASSAR